ncbi:MAG: sporulation integral membrane protein YlbJ [Bacilli bacterium]
MNFFRGALMSGLLGITVLLFFNLEAGVNASIRGLNLWWEIVFPSLLPFFILTDLLLSLGVVALIGRFVQPLSVRLLKLPGSAAFVWLMSAFSGFPSGAKMTVELYEKNELTKEQAQRLLAISNHSNPIFIGGAIAVGFLHNEAVGLLLIVCHYFSSIMLGILLGWNVKYTSNKKTNTPSQTSVKPFGQMLGDAVYKSVQSLLMIGGFIIFFSLCSGLLHVANVFTFLSFLFLPVTNFFQLDATIVSALGAGFLEITLGTQHVAATQIPLLLQCIFISFLLGFSGLSVQSQVASIISQTNLNFKHFFFSRIVHGLLSATLCYVLYNTLYVQFANEFSSIHVFVWNTTNIAQMKWSTPLVLITSLCYGFVYRKRFTS